MPNKIPHRLFFDQFPKGILHLDSNGNILSINNKATTLLGWERTELLGTHLHDFLCPKDNEFYHAPDDCLLSGLLLNDKIDHVFNATDDSVQFEQWWVKKDGVYINIEIQLFSIDNENKNELVVLYTDTTEQRFSNKEVKSLSLFPEFNPTPVMQLDKYAVINYANPAMTELMVRHGFSDMGLPNVLPSHLHQLVTQCHETNTTLKNIEHQFDGIWFNWNFHGVKENDETIIQVYGIDITSRKENEINLKHLKNLAEESNKHKTEFFAGISHELRTPLNGILGMSELILDTEMTALQSDYMDKMNKSAKSLLMIINDILDISKLEAGKLEIDPIRFNIRELLSDIISVLEYHATQKNNKLTLNVDAKFPDFLIGDGLRIRQIIVNFMTNAIKFTDNGKVKLSVKKQHNSSDSKAINLLFSVEDNGIGISENKLDAVFEKYTQAEKSTSRNFGGTGLGLSICQELATLMQGTVWVSSQLEKGSAFSLQLPLTLSEGTSKTHLNPQEKESILLSYNVLLVEDNIINQDIARVIIGKTGCSVDVANDGQHALNHWKNNQYDIIFMDCQMPEMDGYECTQKIREIEKRSIRKADNQAKHIPIIALTANDSSEEKLKTQAAGMDGFLTKPIDKAQLKKILTNL